MIRLYRDPRGDNIFANTAASGMKSAASLGDSDKTTKVYELQGKVKELEKKITSSTKLVRILLWLLGKPWFKGCNQDL